MTESVVIYYGTVSNRVICGPFAVYVLRNNTLISSTCGCPSIERAEQTVSNYLNWHGAAEVRKFEGTDSSTNNTDVDPS